MGAGMKRPQAGTPEYERDVAAFKERMAIFIAAGYELLKVWDGCEAAADGVESAFNADDHFPPAEHLWVSSVDEWLMALRDHYDE